MEEGGMLHTSLADSLHGGVQERGGASVGVNVDDVIGLLLPTHLIHQHAAEGKRRERDDVLFV